MDNVVTSGDIRWSESKMASNCRSWTEIFALKFVEGESTGVHPLDWKRFTYFFNKYIGIGPVIVKVKAGKMQIEQVKEE